MRLTLWVSVATLVVALPAAALTPYRVADIDPVALRFGSYPTQFATVSGRAIFVARSTGELWSSDGTPGGTAKLAAGFRRFVATGSAASYFSTLDDPENGPAVETLWVTDGTVGGTLPLLAASEPMELGFVAALVPGTRRLFISFDDSIHGEELWTSDGTVAGTHLVVDLLPGSADGFRGFASTLAAFHGRAYFSADDGRGPALFSSDGTAAGTERIFTFGGPSDPGVRGPFSLTALPDRLLFFAGTPAFGVQAWSSDGTAAGTLQLAAAGAILRLSSVYAVGPLAYYTVNTEDGVDLWRSDGTPAGTFAVTDFDGEPFRRPSHDLLITAVGSRAAFLADDGIHGFEPWTTDGSVAGTRLIRDVCPGPCDGADEVLLGHGGRLYFAGKNDAVQPDLEPWVSNLNAAGTRLLKDTCPGACSGGPTGFGAAGGFVYLSARDANGVLQLWRTNGRTPGTVRLTDIAERPGVFSFGRFDAAAVGNSLLFDGFDPEQGQELWSTNGSRAGTRQLADLPDPDAGGSRPQYFMKLGTRSLFFANDGTSGAELWTSDGTSGGTHRVAELEPGPGPSVAAFVDSSAEAGGRLAFLRVVQTTGSFRLEVWGSDGTAAGTARLAEDAEVQIGSLEAFGGRAFFLASDEAHGIEPWVTDGTPAGTHILLDTVPGPESGGTAGRISFFRLGGRLVFRKFDDSSHSTFWLSDGTTAGTVPLDDVYPFLATPLSALSGEPVEAGGKVYFDRGSASFGSSRLWVTDLTEAGTREIGALSVEPAFRTQGLFAVGSTIYAFGESELGPGLWATDGRPDGVRLLGRFPFDPNEAKPAAFSGKLFFRTRLPNRNDELWVTNGTVGGTRRVQDSTGGAIEEPRRLVTFGNQLICATSRDLWRTNGTAAGTARLLLRPFVQTPKDLVVAGSRLYFSHKDDEAGTELWALRP